MIRVSCKQCGATSGVIQPGDERYSDPDSAVSCDCCPEDHHHGQAANSCPAGDGGHEGARCPEPSSGRNCVVVTPAGEACPGGHCGLGVDGCAVCRPVNIEILLATVAPG